MIRSIAALVLVATFLGACSGAPEAVTPVPEPPEPSISSPIVGVPLEDLIAYQPQPRQRYLALSGWKGSESKAVDFDSRVGVAEDSQIQSVLAGEIEEVYAFVTPWHSTDRAASLSIISGSKDDLVRQVYLPLSASSIEAALGLPLDELEGMEVEQGQLLGSLAPDESPEFSYEVEVAGESTDPQAWLESQMPEVVEP